MKKKYIKPVINKITAGMPAKVGTTALLNITPSIEGHAVDDLIQKFGSPLFVLSEKTIRQTYRNAYNAFKTRYPKIQFAWSYKTNYLSAVCGIFHQEGSWAEVVSGFEYQKALKNGVPGEKIIFNGPDKSLGDLTLAIRNGSLIHIDHMDEIYMLNQLSESLNIRPQVAIRVNLDAGIHPVWDRFGFNYENGQAWEAITNIMAMGKLELKGLHTHIGTYIQSPNPYEIAVTKLIELYKSILEKFNKTIDYIDIGGGFASKNTLRGAYRTGEDQTPDFATYADGICNTILNSGIDIKQLPTLVLETGRALIDDAGYLLGSVLANKRLSSGQKAIIVDFGVNILFTSFWYEHKITPAAEPRSHQEDMIIYGPLCMNIDVIRSHASLPALSRGDRVVVHRVGAYNMTQWMQFIAMRPNVILIDEGNNVELIRKRETVDTLLAQEVIPKHLTRSNL